ncbi:MAG: DUF4404 family protein [Verrucomicrobiota bacterium]
MGFTTPVLSGVENLSASASIVFFLFGSRETTFQFIMLKETISNIEERLQGSGSISVAQKEELLQLLSQLKREITALPAMDDDKAKSIAGFTEMSTHQATRGEKNPELLKLSLQGLSSSVEGFEKSHPDFVALVNRLATTLSNMGI